MAVLEIIRGDTVIRTSIAEGTLLSQALLDHRCAPDMPCGGCRRCRKCRVTALGNLSKVTGEEKTALSQEEQDAGIRLACCTRILGDAQVSVPVLAPNDHICSDGVEQDLEGDPAFSVLGAAVDVGTTTLAARLYDRTGLLTSATAENPQRMFGADVISRIGQAMTGKAEDLAAVVRQAIDGLLMQMCAEARRMPQEIDGLVITGNTTMLCLLTGENVSSMSSSPFVSGELFGKHISAQTLCLSCAPEAQVYLPRCMSAFIGADITCALLAGNICTRSETALLADIGTNGEIALWHRGKLTCCSTAAGPAFEGANLSQGMPGGNGAIDHVQVRNGRLDVHIIGDCGATGICGSGVADTLACLLQIGEMDRSGYLVNSGPYRLTASVSLTQADIRQVQLAKGSIRAGIETLLHYTGLQTEDIDLLAIAGGFGSYLSLDSAVGIGLFPPEFAACTHVLGNAALSGASMLLDRLIQQCVLQILEPICEAKFHEHSYGFRPNRCQEHAIALVYKNIQVSHCYFVVDIDIKGFFDNVSHGKLLKQMWTLGTCVRYADDFKLFTKNYQQAKKLFYAVQDWLKGRLGLDISPEKSKIVNLRKQYSEFLGLRIKAANHGSKRKPNYVVESHIKEKSIEKITENMKRLIHDIEFPGPGKRAEHAAVARFNDYVFSVHNYYDMATMVCHDLHPLAFSVHKSLKARLQKRLKTAKQVRKKHWRYPIPDFIKERYGDSEQLRFVREYALIPIG